MPRDETIDSMIDAAAIRRFVDVVFGGLDGYVAIRLLAEKGTPARAPNGFFTPVGELAEQLATTAPPAAGSSRAVFVVPGTVAVPGSARPEDIAGMSVLLVDLDDGDIASKRAHLEQHLGLASLVVASGGETDEGDDKLHLYSKLDASALGVDLERVRAMREAIARRAGGDTSFASLHQPIRVPGTVHGKAGRHAPVRILEDRLVTYRLEDLEALVAALPAFADRSGRKLEIATLDVSRTIAELAGRSIREGGVDGITRFDALSKMMGSSIRQVRLGICDVDTAWSRVLAYNASNILPPWEETRLRREFEALQARDLANHSAASRGHAVAEPDTGFSEDALAARFVARHGADWRHLGVWGAWLHWNGSCWRRDETGLFRETVRQVCRTAAASGDKEHEARRIRSDRTIAAVARIVACDPSVALRHDDLDAHAMLLNTPAGIIDLDSGEVRDHERGLLMTQMTSASPGTGCARWLAFHEEITAGDAALQGYLKRLAGYLLTGATTEQMFAFFHGSGANGKSVFIQTLAAAMGDYAATATLDTFMASSTSRHLTELAGLRAARLVIVPETETGRSWAQGRIKTVTGGEKIRANFMHRDQFEYLPQFKLIVAGNHRPALVGTGEAMRRRLHLVPFAVTIPPERRDPALPEMLRTELDGILGWMLEGCAQWRSHGLAPPAAVQEAARDYFADEDLVGQWIEEACETGPAFRATARDLFANWSAWAEKSGHPQGTAKLLGEALRQKGFRDLKVNRARGRVGIRLRGAPVAAEDTQ